jgi:hypothetical protein
LDRPVKGPGDSDPASRTGSGGRAQRWRRLGTVVRPDGQPLANATVPTPLVLNENRHRLYYGALDPGMVSRVEYLEIDPAQPTRGLSTPTAPVLDVGADGYFDDNGVVPAAFVAGAHELLFYYIGFQKHSKIPYTMLTGLAASRDGGDTFSRVLTTPLLERSPTEPFFRTAPWLLPTAEGWRMWYIGGGAWLKEGGRLLPTYSLRTMASTKADSWPGEGESCLVPLADEIGFGRPSVVLEEGIYRMWYSIRRRQGYRLGYAESADGVSWQRRDELLELGQPQVGFDDEMTCYPAVVRRGNDLLLYYCGNGYGRSGIGVAVLERD